MRSAAGPRGRYDARMPASTVVYEIDEADRLVSVNDEWTSFAVANDAPELSAPAILGIRLWDAVTDPTTRELYRSLLVRVRHGAEVTYRFRCDGPAVTRDMLMHVGAIGYRGVRFTSRVHSVAGRRAQPILDRRTPRSGELIRVCGWCKRIAVADDRWEEVEVAIPSLGLHAAAVLPDLTHGICPSCYRATLADFGVPAP